MLTKTAHRSQKRTATASRPWGPALSSLSWALNRACPVWVHFHARLVLRVTDRIILLRVRPTAPSRRPFDPPSPGYFLLSGIRISFSSLPSLFFRVEPDAQLALASARSFALARGRRAITQRLCVSTFHATSRSWFACPLLNNGLPRNPFLKIAIRASVCERRFCNSTNFPSFIRFFSSSGAFGQIALYIPPFSNISRFGWLSKPRSPDTAPIEGPPAVCFIRSKLRFNIFVSASGLPPTNSQSTITPLWLSPSSNWLPNSTSAPALPRT